MSAYSVKLTFLGLLMSLLVFNVAGAEKVKVTFITASDVDTMSQGERDGNNRGGMARLAGVVKAEKEKNDNAIYVFSGDFLSPSVLSGIDKGEHMVELMNMNPPDIFVPGNHEFDFGQDIFFEKMEKIKFTKLATNIRFEGEKLKGFMDTKILEFKGVKIGFMGLTTDTTPDISSPENIKFLDPIKTAKKISEKLKNQGADIIVVATHTSTEVDFQLLHSNGIDIVLSGHDHVIHTYYNGKSAFAEAGEQAEYVVMTDVEFDVSQSNGTRKVNWHPNFRIIDTKDAEVHTQVAEKVREFENQLDEKLGETIAEINVEMSTLRAEVRAKENLFGNIVADAIRKNMKADVAFTNGGGIRGNKIYKTGHKFTIKDIYQELPFGDLTMKIEINGKTLVEVLENSVASLPEGGGKFLQVSNLKFDVDVEKNIGSRVSNVKIGGENINMNKLYTVATPDFIAKGGDGYDMLKGAKIIIGHADAKLMANDVVEYIKEKKQIKRK